ncbi:MAG: hypothetical protein Ta2B_24960 [Termitinemataceae bacterium]|nr:MAG: hypothetical protein Ta2B_24960 [Termitinemataceae bacterium]
MYDELLAKIEDILKTALPADENADWAQSVFLTENTNHSQLTSSCCDLLLRGGKRWRPLLAALICESFGGGQAVLPLSPLIEFCHNASLIHDDIEDNSDLRRGKPAIHKIYGNDTAINSGSFLYFLPLVCVDSWSAPDSFKLRLYQLWAANMRRLHLGQSMDIAWHRDRDFFPVVEQYFQMCALKTGVLAKMAVLTGALAAETAGADTKITMRTQILADAAEKIGAAFQILDDVKNLTAEIAGKNRM